MVAAASIRLTLVVVAVAIALGGAGCGSDEPARAEITPAQWANRLVDWFVIDVSDDIVLLDRLRAPNALLLVVTNDESKRIFERQIGDLGKCGRKLERVGEPPDVANKPEAREGLARVYQEFEEACGHYERVSELLLKAVPRLGATDLDEQRQAHEMLADVREPSMLAAQSFRHALELAGREPVLRAAGLRGQRQ